MSHFFSLQLSIPLGHVDTAWGTQTVGLHAVTNGIHERESMLTICKASRILLD